MAASFDEIIATVNQTFKVEPPTPLANFYFEDLNKLRSTFFVQYAFDIIPHRSFPDSIGGQKHYVTEEFNKKGLNVKLQFVFFSYEDDEVKELKEALSNLSNHYSANLDVERMFEKAKRQNREATRFHLFITGIFSPVLVTAVDGSD